MFTHNLYLFSSTVSDYLNVTVAPGEDGDDRQAADDDNFQNEDGRPHDVIKTDDTRTVIDAGVASFGAR